MVVIFATRSLAIASYLWIILMWQMDARSNKYGDLTTQNNNNKKQQIFVAQEICVSCPVCYLYTQQHNICLIRIILCNKFVLKPFIKNISISLPKSRSWQKHNLHCVKVHIILNSLRLFFLHFSRLHCFPHRVCLANRFSSPYFLSSFIVAFICRFFSLASIPRAVLIFMDFMYPMMYSSLSFALASWL